MEKANQLPWIKKCHKEIQVQLFLLSIFFFSLLTKPGDFFAYIIYFIKIQVLFLS